MVSGHDLVEKGRMDMMDDGNAGECGGENVLRHVWVRVNGGYC